MNSILLLLNPRIFLIKIRLNNTITINKQNHLFIKSKQKKENTNEITPLLLPHKKQKKTHGTTKVKWLCNKQILQRPIEPKIIIKSNKKFLIKLFMQHHLT